MLLRARLDLPCRLPLRCSSWTSRSAQCCTSLRWIFASSVQLPRTSKLSTGVLRPIACDSECLRLVAAALAKRLPSAGDEQLRFEEPEPHATLRELEKLSLESGLDMARTLHTTSGVKLFCLLIA